MQSDIAKSHAQWVEANQAYLESELQRLRLILRRRILYLRRIWKQDPLQNYKGMVISDTQADQLLRGRDGDAEKRFYFEDIEAAELSRLIEERTLEIQQLKNTLTAEGTPPAIDILTQKFGLTPFERHVLLLCLASELDSSFERLYAYVQDDLTCKYVTPNLAQTLFLEENSTGLNSEGVASCSITWHSFQSNSPLRRFRLVTLEAGPQASTPISSCPLRLDERVTDYMRGMNHLDNHITEFTREVPRQPLRQFYENLATGLKRLIEAEIRRGTLPAINIIGPRDAGKTDVAKTLCEEFGFRLLKVSIARLPTGPERRDIVRLIERECALLPAALHIPVDNADVSDKTSAALLRDTIEGLHAFLFLDSPEPFHMERDMITVRVSKPDAITQRAMWRQLLDGEPVENEIEEIVQQFDFGPNSITRAASDARARALMRSSEDKIPHSNDDLWQACRRQSSWELEDLAQRIVSNYTWDDIVLTDNVARQLREIQAQVAHRSRVYDGWGFGAKLSRGRGISALFAGPSGTGKTMAAEILANDLRLDLYRIDLAGVVSKYIGETEKNLKRVFDAAEASGAILFFDEADALFGKRTEVKDSHDRYANIEINYLLQRMEDYRGLAILATNRKSALDSAFLRRLRFLVDFPFPDFANRHRIWRKVFPSETPTADLDFNLLARLEVSGGNIRNIALNAAFLAASEGLPVGGAHIMRAARREYEKLDKLVQESEFGLYMGLK